MSRVRKAIFPVAGLGTRFLPATKAVPKELMPVVDRPVLQYAVEEARAAGIEEFIFVSSMGKTAMEDHFDRNLPLEETLEKKNKLELLQAVRDAAIPDGQLTMVRQHAPKGLGHAVWCARHAIGDEPFAVLLPDEVLHAEKPCLGQMVEAQEELGGSVIAVIEVEREDTKKYGVLDPVDALTDETDVIAAKGMIEKPAPDAAPSRLACIGRYVLPGEIMSELGKTGKGAGGEVQLTDAIASLIGRHPLHGVRFKGARYDCGSVLGFLEANMAFGLAREDVAPALMKAMRAHLFGAKG